MNPAKPTERSLSSTSERIRFVQRSHNKAQKAQVVSSRRFWVRSECKVFSEILIRFKGVKVQMTYVVAEPCVNCRYTDCALVCPVEAFHLDDDMLVINPETCIDCDACVPECPVEAIFAENNVPSEWTTYTPINA